MASARGSGAPPPGPFCRTRSWIPAHPGRRRMFLWQTIWYLFRIKITELLTPCVISVHSTFESPRFPVSPLPPCPSASRLTARGSSAPCLRVPLSSLCCLPPSALCPLPSSPFLRLSVSPFCLPPSALCFLPSAFCSHAPLLPSPPLLAPALPLGGNRLAASRVIPVARPGGLVPA